jgi:hypothetical protein
MGCTCVTVFFYKHSPLSSHITAFNTEFWFSTNININPFSFVTIHCTAKIYPYKQKEVLEWVIKIAERYVGKKNAKTYGEVNSGEGAVLVRIKPTKVIAEKHISILG